MADAARAWSEANVTPVDAAVRRWEVVELGAARDVAPSQWDRLARRGFHRHHWCATAEACGCVPHHLGVSDGRELRAIVPAYLEHEALHGDLHRRWLGPAHRVAWALGLRLRPTLTVGAPFATSSEPLGDAAALPDHVLDELFRRLDAVARREGARAVIWPALPAERAEIVAAAARHGYARAFAGSSARLDVRWPDFDAYLASRSKSVRRTIRREMEALATSGLTIATATDWRDAAAEADALYRAAFRRRNGRAPSLDRSLFARLAAEPAPGVWAQLARRNGVLVGFSVNLEAGGVVDGTFAAFADDPLRAELYANDLLYEPLRIACAAGFRRLELGPTALATKRLRGAALAPRVTLVRGTGPVARRALATLARLADARQRWKERAYHRAPAAAVTPSRSHLEEDLPAVQRA